MMQLRIETGNFSDNSSRNGYTRPRIQDRNNKRIKRIHVISTVFLVLAIASSIVFSLSEYHDTDSPNTLLVNEIPGGDPSGGRSGRPFASPSSSPSEILSSKIPSMIPSPQPPQEINLALAGTAFQSSTNLDSSASNAINGEIDWKHTHTERQDDPWWMVKLEQGYNITRVVVYNRQDSCCYGELMNFRMEISNAGVTTYIDAAEYDAIRNDYVFDIPDRIWGDRVKIYLQGPDKVLVMSEVEVYGIEQWFNESLVENLAISNIAMDGVATQSKTLMTGLSYHYSKYAIDGSVHGRMSITEEAQNPWWQVKFSKQYTFFKLYVNVKDANKDMASFDLIIFRNYKMIYYKKVNVQGDFKDSYLIDLDGGQVGDWVRISHNCREKKKMVQLNEIEVWGRELLPTND